MSLPSALVAPVAPALWDRQQLEAAYAEALRRLDVAQLAARESAHAAQVYGNCLRAAENYVTTVAGVPDDVRTDLRALLVGGMS